MMGHDLAEAAITFRKALRKPADALFAKDMTTDFDAQARELNRKIMDIQKRAGVAQKVFIRKIGIDLLRKIIEKNPVDTGRSRAAWAPLFVAEGLPIPEASPVAVLPAGQGETEGYYEESSEEGESYYLTIVNNVPYVLQLEYGSSGQAPEGMVRVSLHELLNELKRAFK